MSNKIIICLITANRPEKLQKALLSIKKLDYKNFDLIVADDSFDNTSERIVKKIFPDAVYFRNRPPLKEVLNTNKVVKMAKTDIVCLFHDDDLFETEYFDKIIPLINKNKDIDLAYTNRIIIDENDEVLNKPAVDPKRKFTIFSAEDILDFMLLNKKPKDFETTVMTPGLVFKKSTFLKAGGLDKTINTHYDTNLIMKMLFLSKNVLFINKPLYKSRYWYRSSAKTRSSEAGNVFLAQKEVIDNFLLFSKKNGYNKYWNLRNKIYKVFSYRCIRLNGPISWVSLRFNGPTIQRFRLILKTTFDIIKLNPLILINPKLYITLFLNLIIPRNLIYNNYKRLFKLYLLLYEKLNSK